MIKHQHLKEIKLLAKILDNHPETNNKIGEKDSVINPEFSTPILYSGNMMPVKEELLEAIEMEDYKSHFLSIMKENNIPPETSIIIGFNVHFRNNSCDSTALVTKVQTFLSSKGIKSAVIPPIENRPIPVLSLDLAQVGLLTRLETIHKDMPEQRVAK